MSIKDKAVQIADDAKDALSEAAHRSAAAVEHAKRDVAGQTMSPVEKASSAINEAKNNVQANVDKAKRDLRDGSAPKDDSSS
jgi:hypothetical protein